MAQFVVRKTPARGGRRFRLKVAGAEARHMAYATNDGVRLAYDLSGPEGAPVVTFVEGLSYGTWMWDRQREGLDD
jgi:hypothetical protein